MREIRRYARSSLVRRVSLATLLVTLIGCGETLLPGSNTDFESGIWLLATRTDKPNDGDTNHCRPMLMQLTITRESLTLGTRVFPCNDQWHVFDEVQVQRSAEQLFLKGARVGSLTTRRLELQLPGEEHKILWDLDRPDAPYLETTAQGEFKARPELRDDAAPIATDVTYFGTEDNPKIGFVHAARLPEVDIRYHPAAIPLHANFGYFDEVTGEFRVDPDLNFDGKSTFPFDVYLREYVTSIGTATVHFGPTQDAPRALDTYVTASEDSPTLILPSAFDDDGDPVTIEFVTQPVHGKLQTSANSFLYTPDPDFNGKDTFTFFAFDGQAKSNVATIEVSTIPKNDPPIAIDQDVYVTNDSATPFTLSAVDEDSSVLGYEILSSPSSGQILGKAPNFVYLPAPGIKDGIVELTFYAHDSLSQSAPAKIRFIVTEGNHPSTLLTPDGIEKPTPVWNDGARIFYTYTGSIANHYLSRTDGTLSGTKFLKNFAIISDAPPISSFYKLSTNLYFSETDLLVHGLRLYRTDSIVVEPLNYIIQAVGPHIAEPSVGHAHLSDGFAYLSATWPQTTTEHVCQIWRIDGANEGSATIVGTLYQGAGPCVGLWSAGTNQYLFSGSQLVKFGGIENPPEIVKDLGNSKPEPWMVAVGNNLFFQTKTEIGSEARIDLWMTDGTEAGTQVVKEIETAFFEFNIFSPIAFAGKLYFAHRKSLWSSDGTAAGTSIVATIPTISVVGDGAIGAISQFNGKLYFLATSDAFGREPWVSDGTPAGTQLLRDINPGPQGSTIPSLNPAYFYGWNGQVYFGSSGDSSVQGLWVTDGTTAGTNQIANRPVHTVLGVMGMKLVYYDGHYLYSMKLQ